MASLRRVRRSFTNAAFIGFCWITAAVAIAALGMILWSLLRQGVGGLNLTVFTQSTPAPGSPGGLMNAITGSITMCALGMAIAVVVGVLAGTWLSEYGRDSIYAETVRFLNDILLSAPSVLIGLFVQFVLVAHVIGHFSALAGAVSLALVAVPIVARTTEDVLKLQPGALREAGMALGTPKWAAIHKILWKSAGSGILTGALLAFARISGETAPLIFTSFGNQFFSADLMQPMASLPQVIYNFALSAYDDWNRLAWVGALIISAAVLATNILARLIAREPSRS